MPSLLGIVLHRSKSFRALIETGSRGEGVLGGYPGGSSSLSNIRQFQKCD
jgi:hypothetical protein